MNTNSSAKVDLLIQQFFPWNQPDYPLKPPRADSTSLRNIVQSWIEQKTRRHKNAALALLARIYPILRDVEKALPRGETPRMLFRIDVAGLVKSPASVLDKMVRDWDPSTKTAPGLDFRNFLVETTDLGRFRIVVNFLSDIDLVCTALLQPYAQAGPSGLAPAQQTLVAEFGLEGNRLEDLVHQPPEARTKGERCRKGVFYPRKQSELKVEVQVQTMLEEAWDKKDHFLIYEPRRRGEFVDPSHIREMFAMSELLYVADLTFDRLREAVVKQREAKT
jgi:hypothetical protein